MLEHKCDKMVEIGSFVVEIFTNPDDEWELWIDSSVWVMVEYCPFCGVWLEVEK